MSEPGLLISVVSARGTGSSLGALLAALDGQSPAPTKVEAVIVDNDPLRGTGQVARAVDAGAPPFLVRVFAEPRPWLSVGRNRGICASHGEFTAVTAPDIVPDRQWLESLLAAAQEEQAFAVVGRTGVQNAQGQAFPPSLGAGGMPRPRGLAVRAGLCAVAVQGTGCNLLLEDVAR